MKIPESAFPQILKMVTQSLPYDVPFKPVTPETKTVVSILKAVTDQDSNLKELEGFIYHMATKIDENPRKQESTRFLLLSLIDILQEYTQDTTNEIK